MYTDKPDQKLSEYNYQMIENEVHSLELVDYVISAIEEQKKLPQRKFDTIVIKQELHQLINSPKQGEEEEKKIELALMSEIEDWYLNLAQRDKMISSEDLLFYCENSKPPLSNHAILALARFYLSLPFSTNVRTKFDLIITKLFTIQLWDARRELVETTEKIKEHLRKAYKNWANTPSFSAEDKLIIQKALTNIQKFTDEASSTNDLDELLSKNLFREFHNFKNNLGDKFFEPSIIAASIQCSVILGNRYNELLREKAKSLGKEEAKRKYQKLYEKIISESVGITLSPSEILERKEPEETKGTSNAGIPDNLKEKKKRKAPDQSDKKKTSKDKSQKAKLKVSPLIIILLIVTIASAAGLYFYVQFTDTPIKKTNVEVFDVENSEFKDYLRAGRITGETFFGIVTNKWNIMTDGERKELIGKLLELGKKKGFKKVALINSSGTTVGTGSENNIEVQDK